MGPIKSALSFQNTDSRVFLFFFVVQKHRTKYNQCSTIATVSLLISGNTCFFFLSSTGLFLTHFTVFNFNLSAFLLEYRKALCVCKICTVMSKRTLNLKLLNRHFFSVLGNFYSQFPFYLFKFHVLKSFMSFKIRNLKRLLNCKKETFFH